MSYCKILNLSCLCFPSATPLYMVSGNIFVQSISSLLSGQREREREHLPICICPGSPMRSGRARTCSFLPIVFGLYPLCFNQSNVYSHIRQVFADTLQYFFHFKLHVSTSSHTNGCVVRSITYCMVTFTPLGSSHILVNTATAQHGGRMHPCSISHNYILQWTDQARTHWQFTTYAVHGVFSSVKAILCFSLFLVTRSFD